MVITEAHFLLVRFLADRKRSTLSAKSPPDPAPGIDERCFALMSRRAAPSLNCSQARDGSKAPAPVPVCGRFRAFTPALHLALGRGAAPGAHPLETGRAPPRQARVAQK